MAPFFMLAPDQASVTGSPPADLASSAVARWSNTAARWALMVLQASTAGASQDLSRLAASMPRAP
jgi:hypothetical protein